MQTFTHRCLSCLLPAVLVVLSGCHGGAEKTPERPAQARAEPSQPWAHEQSDLPADPKVRFGTLPNGLRYAIRPHDEPEGRASIRLYVHAGSIMEEEDQRGLAHFIEHMAFNGTRNFAAGEMVEYFQRLGMAFGADTNAHTGFDETVYKLELPEVTPKLLSDSFLLLRDYAEGMLLEEEEIDKERGVILAEMRARDSVRYRTFVSQWSFLFPDSRLPRRFPIGEEAVVRNAPREAFLDYYRTWYRPERMALVVVGDVEPERILPYIERYFGTLPPAQEPAQTPDLGRVVQGELGVHVHTEPEAPATEVSIVRLRPAAEASDSRALRRKHLKAEVGNFILSRRLERLARQEEAPFKEGAAYRFDYLDFFEMAGIDVTTQPGNWEAALAAAEKELRRALLYGFTRTEVKEATAALINGFEETAREAPTRKSRTIADQLTRSIGSENVFTTPEEELILAREVLGGLEAVEALAVFRELWGFEAVSDPADYDGTGRSILITGNLDGPEGIAEAASATYLASQAVPVEAPEEREAIAFAYTDFGEPGEVARDRTFEAVGVRQLSFANNVHLNLKPTDFEAGIVHVNVNFGGGLLEARREFPGLALLANEAYVEGGLGAHSYDEVQRVLAGKSASVSFAVAEDTFQLRGKTSPDDLLLQLRVLAAYLTDPGYRPEALRLARQSFEEVYPRLEHTVEGVFRDEVQRFLHTGDFRFGFPEKEVLMERTLEELETWLEVPRNEGWLEISIVGDFSEDAAIAAVGRTFGALPERAFEKDPHTEARQVAFPVGATEKTWRVETVIERAGAAVYWPTVDMDDITTVRAFGLLARVFDERLRVRIREQLGEGYSPYAVNRSSDTFEDYGYFVAFNLADPDEALRVAGMVRLIGASLAADGVRADELERVRIPLMNQLEEYQRNNNYWLSRVLAGSRARPQQLEWAETLQDEYATLSKEQLDALAREYLRPEKAVEVTVLPVPPADGEAAANEEAATQPAEAVAASE